jgi:hypothetical protein
MYKTVVLTIVLALAAAVPATARSDHSRHSKPTAASRIDPAYQAPRNHNDIPFAPF